MYNLKLAFYGNNGSGKNYVMQNLKDTIKNADIHSFAFAGRLKECLLCMSNIPTSESYKIYDDEDFKNNTYLNICDMTLVKEMNDGYKKYTAEELNELVERKCHPSEGDIMSIREMLVYYGTYVIRNRFNENFWANLMITTPEFKTVTAEIDKINGIDDYYKRKNNIITMAIVTDLRFPSEYEILKKEGFKFVKIERKENIHKTNNIAESYYDEFNADFTFVNTPDDVETFRNNMHDMISWITGINNSKK